MNIIKEPYVSVAQIGSRRQYSVPLALHRAAILNKLYTDIYLDSNSYFHNIFKLIPEPFSKSILGRLSTRKSNLPAEKVIHFNRLSINYFLLRFNNNINKTLNYNKYFNSLVIKKISPQTKVILGYDSASLEIFKWAKQHGIKCLLNQTNVPLEINHELLQEAENRFHSWDNINDFLYVKPLADRVYVEWEYADAIICPSAFIYEALQKCGVPKSKLEVLPHGIDLSHWHGVKRRYQPGSKLNLLFVGLCSIYKGLPLLLEAIDILGDKVSLTCVGHISMDNSKLAPYYKKVNFTGQIPHYAVKQYYQESDLFILPSYSEGSAYACYEALASGLPVITTKNSGSVVRDGMEGFIISFDTEYLLKVINRFHQEKNLLESMSINALDRIQSFNLNRYGERLANIINKYL